MANFNFNKAILGGRLTAEPELKTTPQGTSVSSFSIAVNRSYTRQGENPQTDFINCVAWRQTAEFITKYFHKGSSICVVGSIQTRTWNDQQGQKRYVTEVIVDEAKFVDSKSENVSHSGAPAYGDAPAPAYSSDTVDAPKFEEMENDDDLPF